MNSQPSFPTAPENRAQAFGRAYRLFADVCLFGPQEASIPYLRELPELAGVLPGTHPDELAADHYQIFGLEIHPFESAFLEPGRLVGGRVTEQVLLSYSEGGFSPDSDAEAADHLGWELRYLSDLCWRQAQAADGLSLTLLGQSQIRFLEEHLLTWLPGLVQAVRCQENPFYTALTELILVLAVAHYRHLARQSVAPSASLTLPDAPDLLADESTSLRDIAAYLLTPAYSGVYFSRADIQRLAKGQGVPRGFGDRLQMLTNLLRNAAEYDQVPALAASLRRHITGWLDGYQAMRDASEDEGVPARFIDPWMQATRRTVDLLSQIEILAQNHNAGE